jgi:hypothetical protein
MRELEEEDLAAKEKKLDKKRTEIAQKQRKGRRYGEPSTPWQPECAEQAVSRRRSSRPEHDPGITIVQRKPKKEEKLLRKLKKLRLKMKKLLAEGKGNSEKMATLKAKEKELQAELSNAELLVRERVEAARYSQ